MWSLNCVRPSRFHNKWSLPFLQSSFHSRVVLQMTPASSACVLPAVFMSNVQSISLFWVVSQTTLFRKIGPVPWPKAALLRGWASVETIQESELTLHRVAVMTSRISALFLGMFCLHCYIQSANFWGLTCNIVVIGIWDTTLCSWVTPSAEVWRYGTLNLEIRAKYAKK